ncbi:MAG: hypothetical protein RMI04_08560 [Thermofilaceae archaeon]|nr:hypothetical protein [Thermofilaceae archaeon]
MTSPFEGTSLIDYNTYDVGKFVEREYITIYKGKDIKLPFPMLGYDINRSNENALRILEKNVYTKDILEICYPYVGYNFIVATEDNFLYIFISDSKREKDIEEKMANLLPSDVFKNTRIEVIARHILEKYLHPKGHYKPHNVLHPDVLHQLKHEAEL